jgi:hypothetical protein
MAKNTPNETNCGQVIRVWSALIPFDAAERVLKDDVHLRLLRKNIHMISS